MLGRGVAVAATAVCGLVFGLSLWRGVGLLPAISTAVGLGVAAIPEALPTIATTVLALGSGRMRRNGTLIRTLSAAEGLGSVTHAFDMNQRLNVLPFTAGSGTLEITAPANANLAPPGHYWLFIVDANGVPSVASMVQVGGGGTTERTKS